MSRLLQGLLLFSAPLFAQLPFNQLVVFGDSLSDNGNLYFGTSELGVPTPAPPLYTKGEFTDGPDSIPATSAPLGLWIEQLATMLNVPVPQPFTSGGTNYAVASAETGKNSAYTPLLPTVPYLTDQLGIFLTAHSTPPANALYVFWGGSNDIFAGASATTAAANIQGNIDTLATAGAKYFLWINLPPVGDVPDYNTTSSQAPFDAASVAFNQAMATAITQLKAAHPGITILTADAYALFNAMAQNPAQFGFVNVLTPAQGIVSVNPDTYLFWDIEHPTTSGHSFLATVAFAAIESAFATGPVITSLENAADFQLKTVTAPAAPNSFLSLYALNLGAVSGSNLFPSTSDQGIQVLVNGTPAPLYGIAGSANLVNIALPANLPTSGTATVAVETSSGVSTNFTLPLAADDVGIFRLSADPAHPNQGAVIVADTAWRVMPASTASIYNFSSCVGLASSAACGQPAQPGTKISIYFTGGGLATINGQPTAAPLAPGAVAPVDGSVLYETVAAPVVTIGGVAAPVTFSGIAPGTAAEYQINTMIPSGSTTGDSVPVTIKFGSTTDTVTIAVQ